MGEHMSVKFMRKTAVAVAATALLGGGLTVGVGQGVAGAEGSLGSADSSSDNCKNSGSVDHKGYRITKSAEDGGTVAPDGTVVVNIKVSGAGGLVTEIRDFFPDGFVMEKVELNPKWLIGGQKWENATTTATVSDGAVRLGGSGWTTAGNATVSMRVTYRAPKNIVPGQTIPMPGVGVRVSAVFNEDFKDMDLCLSGRLPNPVEGGSSILRGLGLGSVADMGDNVTGSISDPSSPLNR